MGEIHQMMRDVPTYGFALMVIIPLAMSIGTVILGWEARNGALKREREAPPGHRPPKSDAFGAAITVAIVRLSFALLMLWGRFG